MNKEIATFKNHKESLTSVFRIDELKEHFFTLVLFLTRWLTFYCWSFFCFLSKLLMSELIDFNCYSFSPAIKNKHLINIYSKYPNMHWYTLKLSIKYDGKI